MNDSVEHEQKIRPASRAAAWLTGIVLLNLILAGLIASVQFPVDDEAYYSSPAVNWINHRHFGTTIFESKSFQGLETLEKRTFWIVPVYPITLTVWTEIVGFSLWKQRLLSAVFGALAVIAWYWIVRALSRDERIGLVAAAMIAVDNSLLTAASGRPDMMGLSWGAMGIAAYLALRSDRFLLSLLLGYSGVVLAGLTHPLPGVLAAACLTMLVAFHDLRRMHLPALAISTVPFVAGLFGLWLYIHPHWKEFYDQFYTFNVKYPGRLASSISLTTWWNVAGYVMTLFKPTIGSSMLAWLKMIVPITYAVTLLIALFHPRLRKTPGFYLLFSIFVITCVLLPLIAAYEKLQYYVHILILLPPLMAVSAAAMWRHRIGGRAVITALVLLSTGVQGLRAVNSMREDSLGRRYRPAIATLQSPPFDKGTLWGDASWAYGTGFDRLVEDPFFGLHSGKRPDFLVLEKDRDPLTSPWPELRLHARKLFDQEYELAYSSEEMKVYKRR